MESFKKLVNKVIAVEGLDKTGKSTFVDRFDTLFHGMYGTTPHILKKSYFPNSNTPIGKSIRTELASSVPNENIVNSPNFLSEMTHFWMQELYDIHFKNLSSITVNNINKDAFPTLGHISYIFDRYFISTLAYQAFYNNSKADLDFIKTVIRENKFLKMPTDIIMFDLPNSVIIERTLIDQENDNVDSNDTLDEDIINKRRKAYEDAIKFLSGSGVRIHWFKDVSIYETDDLVKVLMGKIFG